MIKLNEGVVEDAALEYFRQLGYQTEWGPRIAVDGQSPERSDYREAILRNRLNNAVTNINPNFPPVVIEDAIKRLSRAESQNELAENARVHSLIVNGVPVEIRDKDGTIRTELVKLIDFDNPQNNDWLVVNQFTVVENQNRRPDIVVFINGLPIGLFELKNPTDENATLKGAWNQIQTYRHDIPSIFLHNALSVISDGTSAAMSSFSGTFEHYAPWKTIDGREIVTNKPALEVLIRGVFDQKRLLDIIHNFVLFSEEPKGLVKRVAKYHQYWAVNAAVESTIEAALPNGDKRGGVIWHTQGSGKSIEMLLYASKIMRDQRMNNPTLVFITDRNDLDNQLFGEVFAPAVILPEKPVQAESRSDLRNLLKRSSGGIIFTTLQKFAPEEKGDTNPVLTDRRNIVLIADEAHRSHYKLATTLNPDGTIKSGLAKHLRDALPNGTFLGFTGTPIERADKSTRAVFGDYVDIYDLTRAVEDGATVRIFYESRLVEVTLDKADLDLLDEEVEEITEDVEITIAEQAKSRWSRIEAIVGSNSRLDLVAKDIVDHWGKRRNALLGKAMIVTMSRRIAVELYTKIVELRPDWHSDDPTKGTIKVVMTGSAADPANFQPHIYSKDTRRELQSRAKDPDDPLELVIVRDMWLTGFDSPSLHTMYLDKPMRGAGLMQAIARVNRTFRDKPGGLIVDYIGIATSLQEALAEYSPSDRDQAGIPIDEIVAVMLEKHDIVISLLHGSIFNSSPKLSSTESLAEHAKVLDFVMSDPDRTVRYLDQVLALSKAFALCGARDEAINIVDDVRLFTGVRAAILKIQNPDSGRSGTSTAEIDTAISQLVNKAIGADEVVDVYKLAGIDRPELSILSDEFLDSLALKDKPSLQMGALRRLINDQIKTIRRTNIVQARKFSEQLEEAINRYTNRSLTTAEIIAELVKLAKDMRGQSNRHLELGLSESETAFYDAIVQNDSAVLEMGDEILKTIAISLVNTIRESATIDWNIKDSVKAAMRAKIRRLLAKYDYPPDKSEKAVELVLEQAELLAGTQ